MSEYYSDAEQAERLKKLVKTHGSSVLTGVLLALSMYFGWSWWQNRQAADRFAQASQYQQLTEAASAAQAAPNDQAARTRFLAQVNTLSKAQPDSIYAVQALLLEARLASERGDYAAAVKALQQARASKLPDAGMQQVVALRLARAQQEQGQGEAALATLAQVNDPAFVASAAELRGDILMDKNDRKGALAAYQQAWTALEKRQEPRQTVRFKLESLGADVKDITVPVPVTGLQEDNT